MIRTSVVILNWNGQKFLEKFLPAIIQHTEDADTQVVIADNGSTDQSIAYITQHFPHIPLIRFDKNYGFTGGYNRAIAQIATQYTVLLNSDVEVHSGWLQPLIAHMDMNPDTAACTPKLLSQEHPAQFEYAGAAGGFIDILGYPFCRGRILDHIETDDNQYDTTCNVFWASGACMVVRTEVYKRLGGLDDDFFAHMEEIDLCWRMQNAGYRVQCVSAATVYHVGGGTLPNNNPRKLFYNYRNNLLMLYKNLPARYFYVVLSIRLLLDGLSAVVFLLRRQPEFFMAVIRAHRDFFRLRHGKRLHNQLNFNKLCGVYRRSILASYFFARRHKFQHLDYVHTQ
jgi:GT2 family glycosyltransferase